MKSNFGSKARGPRSQSKFPLAAKRLLTRVIDVLENGEAVIDPESGCAVMEDVVDEKTGAVTRQVKRRPPSAAMLQSCRAILKDLGVADAMKKRMLAPEVKGPRGEMMNPVQDVLARIRDSGGLRGRAG